MSKDYDAIVRKHWEQVNNDFMDYCRSELVERFKEKVLPENPALLKDSLYENYAQDWVQEWFDPSINIDKKEIRKILRGAPEDLIDRVAKALAPNGEDVAKLWFADNGPFLRLDWLKSQQGPIKDFKKHCGPHLSDLQKRLANTKQPLPRLMKDELQKAAQSLQEAMQLADAYIQLCEDQDKRLTKEGEERKKLTSSPYWNNIIKETAGLVEEAIKDRNNHYLSDKSPNRLLANLLHLAYPKIWKNDRNTLKLLRNRV